MVASSNKVKALTRGHLTPGILVVALLLFFTSRSQADEIPLCDEQKVISAASKLAMDIVDGSSFLFAGYLFYEVIQIDSNESSRTCEVPIRSFPRHPGPLRYLVSLNPAEIEPIVQIVQTIPPDHALVETQLTPENTPAKTPMSIHPMVTELEELVGSMSRCRTLIESSGRSQVALFECMDATDAFHPRFAAYVAKYEITDNLGVQRSELSEEENAAYLAATVELLKTIRLIENN